MSHVKYLLCCGRQKHDNTMYNICYIRCLFELKLLPFPKHILRPNFFLQGNLGVLSFRGKILRNDLSWGQLSLSLDTASFPIN